MTRLETERLILRDWSLDDAADMFAYSQDPEVGPNAGWPVHESINDSIGIIQQFIKEDNVWAVELKTSGKVIGSIGLHRDGMRSYPQARMLGYVIGHDYWGNEYAVEALRAVIEHVFSTSDTEILSIDHFSFNPRSGRVAQKLGFKYEGEIRMARLLFDGRVCDAVLYSLTRDEYLERKEGIKL